MIAKHKTMECVAGSVSKRREATPLDLFKYKHSITIIIIGPNSQFQLRKQIQTQ